jgi:hypothetical protein
MAATRQAQLLMEPEEFERLKAEAHRRGLFGRRTDSLRHSSNLFGAFSPKGTNRGGQILSMKLPKVEWERAKKDIENAHANLH